jgi:hypothetical protein
MTIRDGWGRPFTPEEFDELWARNRELAAKLARLVEEPARRKQGTTSTSRNIYGKSKLDCPSVVARRIVLLLK